MTLAVTLTLTATPCRPPTGRVAIPSADYKIVMDPARLQAIAFIMPQEEVPISQIADYRVSVRQVEEQTQLNFFIDMPEEQQETLEARVSPMWN